MFNRRVCEESESPDPKHSVSDWSLKKLHLNRWQEKKHISCWTFIFQRACIEFWCQPKNQKKSTTEKKENSATNNLITNLFNVLLCFRIFDSIAHYKIDVITVTRKRPRKWREEAFKEELKTTNTKELQLKCPKWKNLFLLWTVALTAWSFLLINQRI